MQADKAQDKEAIAKINSTLAAYKTARKEIIKLSNEGKNHAAYQYFNDHRSAF